jgi:hypothetical protein
MSFLFSGNDDGKVDHTPGHTASVEEARVNALSQLPDEAFMEEMKQAKRDLKGGAAGATEKMMRLAKSQGPHFAKRISEKLPGVTGLLNRRRLAYSLVDNVFRSEAVFDRIHVFQVPRVVGETFEDSILIKPETTQQREEEENPCGIIVSAGLKALDALRSNGMDIGHLINFGKLSPTRLVVDVIRGVEVVVLVIRVGDIVGSMDLPYFRAEGKVATKPFIVNGAVQHRLCDPAAEVSETLAPALPWMSKDY